MELVRCDLCGGDRGAGPVDRRTVGQSRGIGRRCRPGRVEPGQPRGNDRGGERGGGRIETTALSGAATAYSRREVDLSQALLARFVEGTCSPAALSDWWASAEPGVLRSRGREAVLEEWLAAR